MSDQRRFERYDVTGHDTQIFINDDPNRVCPVINISRGGLYFYSSENLRPGTKLHASVDHLFEIDVEVVRCEDSDEPGEPLPYRIGAMFSDDSPLDTGLFSHVLEHMLGI